MLFLSSRQQSVRTQSRSFRSQPRGPFQARSLGAPRVLLALPACPAGPLGGERLAQARIRRVLELAGACVMMAAFVALAIFG